MWPFDNKNKKNGFTFTDERVVELKEAREHILTEYSYIDSIKLTDNRVIRLSDSFSDSRELIAFYDLKPEKCVVVLGYEGEHMYDLNVVPLIHKDIAAVFATHEKGKQICFPDGISEKVHLYNVVVVDKKKNKINVPKKHFNLFTLPTKSQLTKTIFGKEQRNENIDIEKTLLSMNVMKSDHVYFYLANKASEIVRKKIFDFKDKFFEIKNKTTIIDRVYPRVPDEVHGGSFDWEQAEKDAVEGTEVGKFYGSFFYRELSKNNEDLSAILNKEQLRIMFVESFPTLEDKLSSQGYTNGFGQLGKYAYVAIDRARYDNYTALELRGSTDRNDCFWNSFLKDLESIYENKLPERYSNRSGKEEQDKNITKSFYSICEEMIDGLAYSDDEIISYINFNSSIDIIEQVNTGTTFSFVKEPVVDTQNKKIKELMFFSVYDYFKQELSKKVNENFIANDLYKVI